MNERSLPRLIVADMSRHQWLFIVTDMEGISRNSPVCRSASLLSLSPRHGDYSSGFFFFFLRRLLIVTFLLAESARMIGRAINRDVLIG